MKAILSAITGLLCFFGTVCAQPVNRFIIVDQFGYLPESQKIAVLKNPEAGFDANSSFAPGSKFVVVNAVSGEHVLWGQPDIWNSGNTDASSGDKAWHFDFSEVTAQGRYYILDSANNQRSYEFGISPAIYQNVLKHAVRSFYYQRVGFPKEAQYAGAGWADGASHVGPLQDKNCRLYNAKNDPSTERDLSGGWYDAGDYNKYTNWTANYVVEMMKAYIENPAAWGDDYNIPESGNSIPDLLDEAKWGIDHLLRMQQDDGGVLCIVGESHASPPSSATGQSVYGPATTAASFNTAAAFAISAGVYRSMNMTGYADTLIIMAEKAWDWALAHPAVIFHNNSASNGSQGVGAGDQEESDYGRLMAKLEAACFLFGATGYNEYRNYFDSNYDDAHLLTWTYAYPYEPAVQDLLLYYTKLPEATAAVSTQIKNTYKNAMLNNTENFPAFYAVKDPYQAHMDSYTWGSNNQKGAQGSMYYNMIYFGIDAAKNQDAFDAAQGYIHYIHGVNPLNLVYLSNMYDFGGDSCVNEFYHSWFTNGSAQWDRVGTSLYGPPPGYVPGGPNPTYNWDNCCNDPRNCGSADNNQVCDSENLTPPLNQPKQKSYKDFNTSWPLNSWEITENSCGYQVSYLRLLSKFVSLYDCSGDSAGTAILDTCGICSGGNTGRIARSETCDCPEFRRKAFITDSACKQYISPSGRYTWTSSGSYSDTILTTDGCDSILFYELTIHQSSETNLVVTSCDDYTSPSGKYIWNQSGIYNDTISGSFGCDSIIYHIDLAITSFTQSEVTVVECDSFLSPGGKTWTQSGIYADTIPNNIGCDSIITFILTIPVVDLTVTQSEDTLTAAATDASFQWLQCGDYVVIDEAVNHKFTPATSGDYAVEVTQNGCVDTSVCYTIVVTGVFYNTLGEGLLVYPNPVDSHLTVNLPEAYESTAIEIKSMAGQVVLSETHKGLQIIDLPVDFPSGIYLLSILNNLNQGAIIKLVVK